MGSRDCGSERMQADMIACVRAEMERAEASRATATRVAAALAGLVLAIGTGVILIAQGTGAMAASTRTAPTPRVVASAIAPESPEVATADSARDSAVAEAQPETVPEPAAAAVESVADQPAPETKPKASPKAAAREKAPAVQKLKVAIGDVGYEPSVLTAKAGKPIRLTVGKGEGCAAGFLMPKLGVEMDNSSGPATKNLGVLAAGDYRFTCAMEMVEGVLRVR